MKLPIAALVLLVISFSADASEELSWKDAVSLIGSRPNSEKFRSVTSKYGAMARSNVNIDFETVGITFRLEQAQIVEVEFQIAPGKAITDVAYRGTLPDKVTKARNSPEDALNTLGKASRDVTNGYRQLVYELPDVTMTLYYGPQLDYVTFKPK